jgi:ubiquitin C-terminal hydrolase
MDNDCNDTDSDSSDTDSDSSDMDSDNNNSKHISEKAISEKKNSDNSEKTKKDFQKSDFLKLENIGNSCYANCVIQSLLSLGETFFVNMYNFNTDLHKILIGYHEAYQSKSDRIYNSQALQIYVEKSNFYKF